MSIHWVEATRPSWAELVLKKAGPFGHQQRIRTALTCRSSWREGFKPMTEDGDPAVLRQRRLVISGYVIQMVMYAMAPIGMPFLVLVPLIYIVIVRRSVSVDWLRSHANWQLVTSGVTVFAVSASFFLFYLGLREINRTPTTIGTWAGVTSVALLIAIPVWLIYRVMFGLIAYGKETVIERLFP